MCDTLQGSLTGWLMTSPLRRALESSCLTILESDGSAVCWFLSHMTFWTGFIRYATYSLTGLWLCLAHFGCNQMVLKNALIQTVQACDCLSVSGFPDHEFSDHEFPDYIDTLMCLFCEVTARSVLIARHSQWLKLVLFN